MSSLVLRTHRPLVTATLAAIFAAAALSNAASAQVVAPLARGPVVPISPAARALTDARSALVAAPPATTTQAQALYARAVGKYRTGDSAGARIDAVQARALAASATARLNDARLAAPGGGVPDATSGVAPGVPLPRVPVHAAPTTPGAGAQVFPATVLGAEPVGGALGIEEDELVARGRSAVGSCAARHPDQLATARTDFAAVWRAHAAGNVVRERLAVRTLVTRCGVLF